MSNKKIVMQFLNQNPGIKKAEAVKQLEMCGLKRRTIYYYISNLEKRVGIERKVGSGCKSNESKKQILHELKKSIVNKEYKSYRYLARKVGISDKTTKKYLKEEGITKNTRKIVPKITQSQEKRVKKD